MKYDVFAGYRTFKLSTNIVEKMNAEMHRFRYRKQKKLLVKGASFRLIKIKPI